MLATVRAGAHDESSRKQSHERNDPPKAGRFVRAPTGTRTQTGTILSRLPLPIGLWGPVVIGAPERLPNADRVFLKRGAGRLVGSERGNVATEEEVVDPTPDHTHLALKSGHGQTVIPAVSEPCEVSGEH